MTELTKHYLEFAEKYYSKYSPSQISVDWDVYTKNLSNPDETSSAAYIYTENLVLQSANSLNVEDSYRLLWSDPNVMKLYNNGLPRERHVVEARIEKWIQRWQIQNPFSGFVVHNSEDQLLANIALENSLEKESVELVYLSATQFHNKGYGKEYTGAIVFDWIQHITTSELDYQLPNGEVFKNIVATSRPENIASSKILSETLGFEVYAQAEKFGALRDCYKIEVVEEMGCLANELNLAEMS